MLRSLLPEVHSWQEFWAGMAEPAEMLVPVDEVFVHILMMVEDPDSIACFKG